MEAVLGNLIIGFDPEYCGIDGMLLLWKTSWVLNPAFCKTVDHWLSRH